MAIHNNETHDGKAYLHCIAWKVHGGCGHVCHEMCSESQREACRKQHDDDMLNHWRNPAKSVGLHELNG